MRGSRTADSRPCVALFDLDGTLTWRDTLVPFLLGFLRQHPKRLWRLWRLPFALGGYLAWHRDRGLLKGRLIRCVMGGEPRSRVDAWSESFVAGLDQRQTFRPGALAVLNAHRRAGDHLVLLSASPDLYVPRIGALLGFERTLCTEVEWQPCPPGEDRLDGALKSPNRRGEEKSRCLAALKTLYRGLPVIAYGNSRSDLAHLQKADGALLVNGSAAARRAAAAAGIAVAQWT
jgi:phosphatidylglycerophosphatase C